MCIINFMQKRNFNCAFMFINYASSARQLYRNALLIILHVWGQYTYNYTNRNIASKFVSRHQVNTTSMPDPFTGNQTDWLGTQQLLSNHNNNYYSLAYETMLWIIQIFPRTWNLTLGHRANHITETAVLNWSYKC